MSSSKSDFELLEQLPDLSEDILESMSGGDLSTKIKGDFGPIDLPTLGMYPTNDDDSKGKGGGGSGGSGSGGDGDGGSP